MKKRVKTGKIKEIKKQSDVQFGLIEENMELSHNDLTVPVLELICS